jgi:hypothetical protein
VGVPAHDQPLGHSALRAWAEQLVRTLATPELGWLTTICPPTHSPDPWVVGGPSKVEGSPLSSPGHGHPGCPGQSTHPLTHHHIPRVSFLSSSIWIGLCMFVSHCSWARARAREQGPIQGLGTFFSILLPAQVRAESNLMGNLI